MVLSNKAYDVLKNIVLVALPGLATLYAALGELWSLPNVTAVVGTLTALASFLGFVLKMSTRKYNNAAGPLEDGDLIVSEVDGEKFLSLGANRPIEEMTAKDTVRLRVVANSYASEHSSGASQ